MDELEAMLGKPDWIPPKSTWKMAKSDATPPDAIVMTLVKATCRCGEKFVMPSSRPMLELGGRLLKVKQEKWKAEYNHLPRKVEEVETKVSTCPRCFDGTHFTSNDF